MNVFVLDRSMEKSAQYLDDAPAQVDGQRKAGMVGG